jgi:hypothetical protein
MLAGGSCFSPQESGRSGGKVDGYVRRDVLIYVLCQVLACELLILGNVCFKYKCVSDRLNTA